MKSRRIQHTIKSGPYIRLRNYCIAFLFIILVLFRSRYSKMLWKNTFGEDSTILVLSLLFTAMLLALLFHILSLKKTAKR
ncbi:MAG: hypothetical protein WCR72_11735 [Bacteroidota bacterium]